jgi:phage-related protein
MPPVKPAIFHARARKSIQGFPNTVRSSIGQSIWDLQRGIKLSMPLSRAMPAVAPGVEELRIRDADGIYRLFYYARHDAGILIFHAFVKKSQKTPASEITTGRRRFRELIDEIQKRGNY